MILNFRALCNILSISFLSLLINKGVLFFLNTLWLHIICMTIWYCYYIGRYTNIHTYRPRDHERKKDHFGQRPTLPLQANVESWSATIFHKINALQVASKMEQFWQEYIILCSAQGSVGSLRKFFFQSHTLGHTRWTQVKFENHLFWSTYLRCVTYSFSSIYLISY